ncbi:putative 3-dehydroquinate dehydratase, Shikimate dehydrogenase (NADP(+)) [Helianthus annuus]|nr:putative 3-dehydroquinate dehydratase, Shikimate dehydrogenase (NADP(+)) [Helianthus annuus]KAJ0711335.1 putative 3-dehydroquinate dehydratase, Shikimate dehydrogenase (NADP(+)) [Helianthus annuus]
MGSLGVLRKTTMVCVPLMSHSVEQLVGDMFQAKNEGADLVEIRLDFLKEFDPVKDLRTIVGCRPLPIVVVYRPKWDGGLYDGDEKSRLEALMLAKELGAEYIDLELQVASDIMEEHKLGQQSSSKIIVSCFVDRITSLKEDLSHLVTRMQSTGAHIIKLVATAADITELSKIFHLLSHCQIPLIAYSTGERGLISHLLGPKFGGVIVYGSLEGKQVAGLPTLASLREAYGVENIDADTKVFGLISKPFFNVYQSPDFAGYSVGIPYKEAVMEFCDEVHPLAQSIGAVNTIVKRHSDGKLIGYNTDCEASITAIEDALKARGLVNGEASLPSPLTGKQFVLAGAGGAGRALSFGAKSRGARVIVFDIDYDRAKSLALAVSGEARPFEELANFKPEKGAVLANATPIGMHPNKNRIPVPEETLRDYSVVFDAVYTPRKTTLLTDAEAAGAIIVSGVEMFLRQAVGQFNLFTGGKAPEEFMRDIVLSKF